MFSDIKPPKTQNFIIESEQRPSSPFKTMLAGVIIFGLGYLLGGGSLSASNSIPIIGDSAEEREHVDLGQFWKAWNLLDEKYGGKPSEKTDQERVWGAIKGLAESYGDPYTTFFTPREMSIFDQSISGTFSGVGMEISDEDGLLTVISPLKNSPAEKAGVHSGDIIIKINTISTEGMTVDEAVTHIRGKKGTTVKITVLRKGSEGIIVIPIVREDINIPTLDSVQITPETMYVRLYSFTESSPKLIRDTIAQYNKSQSSSLILDLRGNPGGYLDAAVEIASHFLPEGKVVVKEDYKDNSKDATLRSKGYNTFPKEDTLIVLVDGGSASASEILAGALQEQGRARLVGSTTFGKGSVQELVPVTKSTSLKITVARWLTPKNHSLHEGGIQPDIPISNTQTSTSSLAKKKTYSNRLESINDDPVIRRALELIQTKK